MVGSAAPGAIDHPAVRVRACRSGKKVSQKAGKWDHPLAAPGHLLSGWIDWLTSSNRHPYYIIHDRMMLPDQDDPFFHGIFTRTRRLVMCISGITRSVFIINEHMLSVAVPRSGWDCLIHCQINQAGWSSFIAEEINSVNPSYRRKALVLRGQ